MGIIIILSIIIFAEVFTVLYSNRLYRDLSTAITNEIGDKEAKEMFLLKRWSLFMGIGGFSGIFFATALRKKIQNSSLPEYIKKKALLLLIITYLPIIILMSALIIGVMVLELLSYQ